MITRSRFIDVIVACLAGCGGTPHEIVAEVPPPPAMLDAAVHHLDDPELNHPPRRKLLSIDWTTTHVASDPDALALWATIAPTGDDWEAKLDEVPDAATARALAVALLRDGNFTCATPAPPAGPNDCAAPPLDVPAPAATATLADPCLRRVLALWAFDQLEPADVPRIRDALRAIAAIPPPESQLVAAALAKGIPETDLDARLEVLGIGFRAGQRELVNASLGALDERHLIEATQKLHIDGALEVLSAEGMRGVYIAAVTDEQLAPRARIQAMADLSATAETMAPDLRTALTSATRSPDCGVAAAAARTLDRHGEHKLVPKRPHTSKPDAMMRALCVLASYEQLQAADETSPLASYLPSRGLELLTITYNAYSEVDTDGDGDPHTERSIDLIGRDVAVLPEIEDLVRAMHHCTGTTCRSEDHEFRFVLKPSGGELVLARLEVEERPPCKKQAIPTP